MVVQAPRTGARSTGHPQGRHFEQLDVFVQHDLGRLFVRAWIHFSDDPISAVDPHDLRVVAMNLKRYSEVILGWHGVALDPAVGVFPNENEPHDYRV